MMLGVNDNFTFLTIGHRGCAGLEPENTLRGVKRAIEAGCGMVEVDVHLVDGELVVIHDSTVDRTTNGVGRVDSYTLENLRRLDAGKGEKVPLIEEVLALCLGKAAVNIELKGANCVKPLIEMMENRKGPEVLVSSFDWDQLSQYKVMEPSGCVAVLVDRAKQIEKALQLAEELDAYSLNPSMRILSRNLVQQVHGSGRKVFPFTVREVADFLELREAGADGCFVDDPNMVISRL